MTGAPAAQREAPMTEDYIPAGIAALPRDARGNVIPWFALTGRSYAHNRAGFPIIAPGKMERALAGARCWICGTPLGGMSAFVVPLTSAIDRFSPNPPSHPDCAGFAARQHLFMALERRGWPYEKRVFRPTDGGADQTLRRTGAPGGIITVWITAHHTVETTFRNACVIELGEPLDVWWFRGGRPARRDDVQRALIAAVTTMMNETVRDGHEVAKRQRLICANLKRALRWLPPGEDVPPSACPDPIEITIAAGGSGATGAADV